MTPSARSLVEGVRDQLREIESRLDDVPPFDPKASGFSQLERHDRGAILLMLNRVINGEWAATLTTALSQPRLSGIERHAIRAANRCEDANEKETQEILEDHRTMDALRAAKEQRSRGELIPDDQVRRSGTPAPSEPSPAPTIPCVCEYPDCEYAAKGTTAELAALKRSHEEMAERVRRAVHVIGFVQPFTRDAQIKRILEGKDSEATEK